MYVCVYNYVFVCGFMHVSDVSTCFFIFVIKIYLYRVKHSVNTVLQCGPVLLPKNNPTDKHTCAWEAIVRLLL